LSKSKKEKEKKADLAAASLMLMRISEEGKLQENYSSARRV
jgi:hypothetical protein